MTDHRKKKWAAAAGIGVAALAARDLLQKRHSVLRTFPVVGHLRFLLEGIRPEIQQYFIERNWDGRPFDRDTRAVIYQRAKGDNAEQAFGTERDVYSPGYEWLVHSVRPVEPAQEEHRVMVGGHDCKRPYSMSLLNVSAMSFGALSANAIRALNQGAAMGGFLHDTGEGGISPYHREFGGDLLWELGSGYFGARTPDGNFDPAMFADRATDPQVKCISVKLSQGAKPGIGGVLPGAKVTREISEIRGVPEGVTCVSPSAHRAFSTPIELIEFVAHLRELSGGKPTGIKLCVGSRTDALAICKAIREVGTAPDFIVVDGSEGGTGAAPLEFEDNVGMPLTQGLITIHNALVGTGLRDQIRVGASGKIARASDIVKRLIQGADFTNSARAMMMAVGCIQAQKCHTGRCPVGVATQDPLRQRSLDVPSKAERVRNYHAATVAEVGRLMGAMGVADPKDLAPWQLRQNISLREERSYEELYEWLVPGELLSEAPREWATAWTMADPHSFALPPIGRRG